MPDLLGMNTSVHGKTDLYLNLSSGYATTSLVNLSTSTDFLVFSPTHPLTKAG